MRAPRTPADRPRDVVSALRILSASFLVVHGLARASPVGAGQNGMEYSVLLIAVLSGVAYATPARGD